MRIGGRSFGGCLVACMLLLGACGGDDDGDAAPRATVPSSTSTSSSTTTTEPAPTFEPLLADPSLTPEEQVEQAYLFSWQIYLDSLARSDDSFLELVYGDELLDLRMDEISSLRADGQIVRGPVAHDYDIHLVSGDEAVVIDVIHNNLVLHDASSGEPLEEPPDQTVVFQFVVRLEEDRWVIVRGVRV